ncbi:hypothetical protein QX220_06220 [Vibrio vulnificus]|uniref:hypothetical protein n=1 Tax=Vibrio vulnificus TaxID=672 RepID=UPI00287B21E6|nr:hypothetical protein [Vibrio vulnificus]MDS1861235.1 hypothetical protein [Vibrio vulnificus]HCG9749817.1 hypothetical protein [Vibrio parahaemolyticus]
MKNEKEIANDFHKSITNKTKKELFEHINDEMFEEIKKALAAETRIRNEKLYYRFENPITEEIEWCVESKLGAHLKSPSFKRQLALLSTKRRRRVDRNKNKEIYVYPEPAKKPYKTAEELEEFFTKDKFGKESQTPTLKQLGERPVKISELQH